MLVVDAAFVVAALVDGGREGTWADRLLAGDAVAAPHLMPVEVANILRRAVEILDAQLATLDVRLSRATGPRCRFQLPPPG